MILSAELASVSQRFARFSVEADAYAGPLYSTLSRQVALDEDLLAVARHVRRPPIPNVFFAAVHFLLSEAPQHELAAFYGSLCSTPRPPSKAYHAFRDFVISNADRLIPLLEPVSRKPTRSAAVRFCCRRSPSCIAWQEAGRWL